MDQKMRSIIEATLKGDKINALDIGAKGGVFQLPKLLKYTDYIGFEPNSEELDKLNADEDVRYLPYALGRSNGESVFRITQHSSYSSFLEFDEKNFKKHFHLMSNYNLWKSGFRVKENINVSTKTLDNLIDEIKTNTIDFIKLDTQGSELDILKGAINAIRENKIGVIFCEVNFVRIYKEQNLFSDLDLFLRENNYEFIDCRFYPEAIREFKSPFSKGVHDQPRYSVGGDAIYVPDLDKTKLNSTSCFKIGLVLASLGYFGIASNFFNKSNLPQKQQLLLLKYFDSFSLKKLFTSLAPPIVLHYLKRLF